MLLVVSCLLYGAFLVSHTPRAVGGADSSGYMNLARLLAGGSATAPYPGLEILGERELEAGRSIPLGFLHGREPGRMVPHYPPGFPILIAVSGSLLGWDTGPFLLPGLFAALGVGLLYAVGRRLQLPRHLAVGCAAVLATWPTYVFFGVQLMADTVTTAVTLACVLLALRSRSDGGGWSGLGAGACFVLSAMIRPSNVLLAPALALLVLPDRWRVLSFSAGGLALGLPWLAYNSRIYGHPLSTGYSGHLASDLAWTHFPDRIVHYSTWLAATLPLAVVGFLLLPMARKIERRTRLLLVLWTVPFLLFYSFYRHYDTWWYTRFLSPAVPALILAGGMVLHRGLGHARRPWKPAIVGLALVASVGVCLWQGIRLGSIRATIPQWNFVRGTDWIREADPDAIVASMQFSGAIYHYTDAVPVRYDRFDPEAFSALRRETQLEGHDWYALLENWEIRQLRRRMPGEWLPIEETPTTSLFRLEPLPARRLVNLTRAGLREIEAGLGSLPADSETRQLMRWARRGFRLLRAERYGPASALLDRLARRMTSLGGLDGAPAAAAQRVEEWRRLAQLRSPAR